MKILLCFPESVETRHSYDEPKRLGRPKESLTLYGAFDGEELSETEIAGSVMANGFEIVEARAALPVPRIVGWASQETLKRFLEFSVAIRNKNTRATHFRAVRDFLDCCDQAGLALGRLGFAMQARRTWSFGLALIFLAFQQSAFAEEFSGIAVPENSAIVLAVAAEGVQIYESKPNPAGGFQWSLKAPEAELKSTSGDVLGKHGAGPSWTLNDGSGIVGSLPPLKNVAVPGSIPWLLLAVKSKSGSGTLDQVDFVIRAATDGGVAPTAPPRAEGETARVKYRAIYIFLRK